MNIFISYRRKDQPFAAGRVYHDLKRVFGKDSLFKDVDNIAPGADFRKLIFDKIDSCQVFLSIIGDDWRGKTPDGLCRIFDKNDYIKLETECALKNGIKIIPVLLGDCEMPQKNDLPEEIHGLLQIHAARLRTDPDWERDIEKLIETIQGYSNQFTLSKSQNEEDLWHAADKANIIKRFKGYLNAYPQGKYAKTALSRIEELKKRFVQAENSFSEAEARSIPKTEYIRVRGGTFIMGSIGIENEEPPHKVELTDYKISATPVTVGEYKAFCLRTNKSMPAPPRWGWIDSHPMVNVNWHEASAFCEWAQGRLPTEAEWEFAAKGGSDEIPIVYSGRDHLAIGTTVNATVPVTKHAPNNLGIYGMLGNVHEWCNDFYAPYDQGRKINPRGPHKGITKVVRGTSFLLDQFLSTPTHRAEQFADYRSLDLGFRVVREIIDKS
jgi:formylglycine-generating enzyme